MTQVQKLVEEQLENFAVSFAETVRQHALDWPADNA